MSEDTNKKLDETELEHETEENLIDDISDAISKDSENEEDSVSDEVTMSEDTSAEDTADDETVDEEDKDDEINEPVLETKQSKTSEKNYYDIYSNSNSDVRDDFSLELEIERSRMAEKKEKEARLKKQDHMFIFQDAENAQAQIPKDSLSTKNFMKAINGISYKTLTRKRSFSQILLNNGEPLPFAIKSIILQLSALILCTLLIILGVIVVNFFIGNAEDNSVEYISTIERFEAPVSATVPSVLPTDRADTTALNAISSWSNSEERFDLNDEVMLSPDTLTSYITELLPQYTVTLKEGLSNYDLMTQTYDSLALGAPVLVACSSNFSIVPESHATISYALVIGMSTSDNTVTLLTEDGSQKIVNIDAFIEATRFDNMKDTSFSDNLNFLFGNFEKNSAIFITE